MLADILANECKVISQLLHLILEVSVLVGAPYSKEVAERLDVFSGQLWVLGQLHQELMDADFPL